MTDKLTHFNARGEAHMVDISGKDSATRSAIATGCVTMLPETFALLAAGTSKKGDVLAVARLAGIMGAKKTSDLIPLCHPLALSKVTLDFSLDAENACVHIKGHVKTTGQTGVEMEALTAVSTAALTIYDMLKAVDRGMTITDIHLIRKEGGKSGVYEVQK